MKKASFLIVLLLFALPARLPAPDGECYPIAGYSYECQSRCAQTPGSCETTQDRTDMCLLTTGQYPGYGCHSTWDQCCDPRGRDGDGEGGF